MDELPFMATENIMMEAVLRGGDRQDLHERIRVHSMAAGSVVKNEGKQNDLLERIASDPAFGLDAESLQSLLDPNLYIGRCPEQVTAFLEEQVKPLLALYADDMELPDPELTV
jgi:adenylosuccinate lyase